MSKCQIFDEHCLERMSDEQVLLSQSIDGTVSQDSDEIHSKIKRIYVYIFHFQIFDGLIIKFSKFGDQEPEYPEQ